jgi:hypothetical protein
MEQLARRSRGRFWLTTRHSNGRRPRQGLHQRPPLVEPSRAIAGTARIERRGVVGGLISEYRREAEAAKRGSGTVNEFRHGTSYPQ